MRTKAQGHGDTVSARSDPDRPAPVIRALRWLLVALSVWYIGSYLVVALLRIGYPFELEWMEGAVADHVRRILDGQPLYVAPSIEFVPFIYAPLYFYASAGVARILGFSLLPLRLVSFVSSLVCLGLIYAFVRREAGSRFYGLIAAALFAATYRATGSWFDLARPDSLFLVFLLAGLYLARFGRSALALAAAGFLFALSFHTKQTALFIALPVMAGLLALRRLRSLAFIGVFAVLGVGAIPVLNSIHRGWYNYYVFFLPSHGTLLWQNLWGFWVKDLLLVLPVACALAGVLLFRHCDGLDRGARLFYIFALAGMIAAAWSGRVHRGGYNNALLPAYAALAVLGVTGARVLTHAPETTGPGRRRVTAVVGVALVAQLGLLWYNPAALVPSRQDASAGSELVAALARLPGELFMPHHGYLSELAGKKSYAHQMAICDVLNAGPSEAGDRLGSEIVDAFERRRFGAIVLDHPCMFQEAVLANYQVFSRAFDTDHVFWTRSGARTRPELILVPRTDVRPFPAADMNRRPPESRAE
jgi:4-amino-4-deoxy-L-arabinose transferase-like glycosyltransferase